VLACKVLQVGFGSLGKEIFIELLKRKNLKAVGVIDIAKSNLGNDPGILTLNRQVGIKIVGNIEDVKSKPDVALHATTSSLGEAYYQISELLNQRINVLSTCEQLVYPYGNNKKIAKKLHMIAKKNKVSVLGVGVNPGFVMDSLVLKLTSLCSNIHRLRIERVVNIANRRKALQEKMCLGLGLDQYKKCKKLLVM
jgi:4-hydroxy-tetrahydrodipicolinate reductase